jgi:hypothetical protein
MLSLDTERPEAFPRKMLLVKGNDHFGTPTNCRSKNMTIIWIGQIERIKDFRMPGDKAVGHGPVHELASPRKLFSF